jgi:hypothetical protein
MKVRALLFILVTAISAASASGQRPTEITISLNEQFFDSLIDAIYLNSPAPEFQLSKTEQSSVPSVITTSFTSKTDSGCSTIRLLRENKNVRTAVRLHDGRINALVAFTGNYSPPLVGCLDFSGTADTTVELVFDKASQKLFGRVRVNNVNIDGTGGIGGPLVARMVQSSIDKKLNPIEIINLEKLSFPFTLQNQAKLWMHAVGVRSEVIPGALNIVISYEFVKD